MLMKGEKAQEQLRPPVSQFLGNNVEPFLIVCPFYLNLFCFLFIHQLVFTGFYNIYLEYQ